MRLVCLSFWDLLISFWEGKSKGSSEGNVCGLVWFSSVYCQGIE